MKKYKVSSINELSEVGIKEFADSQSYGKLMCWIYMQQFEVAEALIDAGIPINPDQEGYMATPLTAALKIKNPELLEKLLQKGANPYYHIKYDSYPIFYAVNPTVYDDEKSPKLLELLLKYGANPNLLISSGSVLDTAFSGGHLPLIKLLIQYGADFEMIKDNILPSCIKNDELFLFAYEKGANVNAYDKDGNNLLLLAIDNANSKLIDLLLDKNDVNHQNLQGDTPLYRAVSIENEDAIQKLLDRGADPAIENKEGNSVLKLIKYRPNLKKYFGITEDTNETLNNVWENKPITSYIKAIYNRDIIEMENHIKNGGDINETNYRGDSALMIAINTEQEDIAEILILKGIDLSIQNDLGDSALSLCLVYQNDSLKEKIERKQKLLDMDVINAQASLMMRLDKFRAAKNENNTFKMIQMIQNKEIDIVSDGYYFHLHEAVKDNNLGLATALLEIGAMPDIIDTDFWDSVYYAEKNNNPEMVELLKKYLA